LSEVSPGVTSSPLWPGDKSGLAAEKRKEWSLLQSSFVLGAYGPSLHRSPGRSYLNSRAETRSASARTLCQLLPGSPYEWSVECEGIAYASATVLPTGSHRWSE